MKDNPWITVAAIVLIVVALVGNIIRDNQVGEMRQRIDAIENLKRYDAPKQLGTLPNRAELAPPPRELKPGEKLAEQREWIDGIEVDPNKPETWANNVFKRKEQP
jgi:hypothetical protein